MSEPIPSKLIRRKGKGLDAARTRSAFLSSTLLQRTIAEWNTGVGRIGSGLISKYYTADSEMKSFIFGEAAAASTMYRPSTHGLLNQRTVDDRQVYSLSHVKDWLSHAYSQGPAYDRKLYSYQGTTGTWQDVFGGGEGGVGSYRHRFGHIYTEIIQGEGGTSTFELWGYDDPTLIYTRTTKKVTIDNADGTRTVEYVDVNTGAITWSRTYTPSAWAPYTFRAHAGGATASMSALHHSTATAAFYTREYRYISQYPDYSLEQKALREASPNFTEVYWPGGPLGAEVSGLEYFVKIGELKTGYSPGTYLEPASDITPQWVQNIQDLSKLAWASPMGMVAVYPEEMISRVYRAGWFGTTPEDYSQYQNLAKRAWDTAQGTGYLETYLANMARYQYYETEIGQTPQYEAWTAIKLASYFTDIVRSPARIAMIPLMSAEQQLQLGAAEGPYLRQLYQYNPTYTQQLIQKSTSFWPYQYPTLFNAITNTAEWMVGASLMGGIRAGLRADEGERLEAFSGGTMRSMGYRMALSGALMMTAPLITLMNRERYGLPLFFDEQEKQNFAIEEMAGGTLVGLGILARLMMPKGIGGAIMGYPVGSYRWGPEIISPQPPELNIYTGQWKVDAYNRLMQGADIYTGAWKASGPGIEIYTGDWTQEKIRTNVYGIPEDTPIPGMMKWGRTPRPEISDFSLGINLDEINPETFGPEGSVIDRIAVQNALRNVPGENRGGAFPEAAPGGGIIGIMSFIAAQQLYQTYISPLFPQGAEVPNYMLGIAIPYGISYFAQKAWDVVAGGMISKAISVGGTFGTIATVIGLAEQVAMYGMLAGTAGQLLEVGTQFAGYEINKYMGEQNPAQWAAMQKRIAATSGVLQQLEQYEPFNIFQNIANPIISRMPENIKIFNLAIPVRSIAEYGMELARGAQYLIDPLMQDIGMTTGLTQDLAAKPTIPFTKMKQMELARMVEPFMPQLESLEAQSRALAVTLGWGTPLEQTAFAKAGFDVTDPGMRRALIEKYAQVRTELNNTLSKVNEMIPMDLRPEFYHDYYGTRYAQPINVRARIRGPGAAISESPSDGGYTDYKDYLFYLNNKGPTPVAIGRPGARIETDDSGLTLKQQADIAAAKTIFQTETPLGKYYDDVYSSISLSFANAELNYITTGQWGGISTQLTISGLAAGVPSTTLPMFTAKPSPYFQTIYEGKDVWDIRMIKGEEYSPFSILDRNATDEQRYLMYRSREDVGYVDPTRVMALAQQTIKDLGYIPLNLRGYTDAYAPGSGAWWLKWNAQQISREYAQEAKWITGMGGGIAGTYQDTSYTSILASIYPIINKMTQTASSIQKLRLQGELLIRLETDTSLQYSGMSWEDIFAKATKGIVPTWAEDLAKHADFTDAVDYTVNITPTSPASYTHNPYISDYALGSRYTASWLTTEGNLMVYHVNADGTTTGGPVINPNIMGILHARGISYGDVTDYYGWGPVTGYDAQGNAIRPPAGGTQETGGYYYMDRGNIRFMPWKDIVPMQTRQGVTPGGLTYGVPSGTGGGKGAGKASVVKDSRTELEKWVAELRAEGKSGQYGGEGVVTPTSFGGLESPTSVRRLFAQEGFTGTVTTPTQLTVGEMGSEFVQVIPTLAMISPIHQYKANETPAADAKNSPEMLRVENTRRQFLNDIQPKGKAAEEQLPYLWPWIMAGFKTVVAPIVAQQNATISMERGN